MLKLKSFLFVGVLFALCSCNQKPEGFLVEGHFHNAEGKTVYLNRIQNTLTPVDSAIIGADGEFTLQGNFSTMELYLLQVEKDPNAVIYLCLNNQSLIKLEGDVSELTLTYSVENNEQDNILMSEISKHNYQAKMKFQEISNMYLQNQKLVANQDSLIKVCNDKSVQIIEGEQAYLKTFIDNNPNSMATVWALYQQFRGEILLHPDMEIEYWKKVAKMLNEKYPNSLNAKEIKNLLSQYQAQKNAQESTAIGKMAPNFELVKPDGTTIKLSDLRGQFVLLDFWASWCKPCRAENPNVVKAYQQFKNHNFTVFQVSLDKEKQAWINAIKKDGLSDWHHASDLMYWESGPAKLYSVRGIPANFLIHPNGTIIAKDLKGENLSLQLSKILK